MSIKVMSRAWDESKAKGSGLLLLLALADFADDNGLCWPSIETLSKKVRLTPQAVRNNLKKLEEIDELERWWRVGRSSFYIVKTGASKEETIAARNKAESCGATPDNPSPEEVDPPKVSTPHPSDEARGASLRDLTRSVKDPSLKRYTVPSEQSEAATFVEEPHLQEEAPPSEKNGGEISRVPPPASEEPPRGPPKFWPEWRSWPEWRAALRGGNQPATLRLMFQTLYPEHEPPSFGYIGKVARRVGAVRLAEELWKHSTRPVNGDVLAYVQGIFRREKPKYGEADQNSGSTDELRAEIRRKLLQDKAEGERPARGGVPDVPGPGCTPPGPTPGAPGVRDPGPMRHVPPEPNTELPASYVRLDGEQFGCEL